MAHFGHAETSLTMSAHGVKQTSRRKAVTSVFDPTATLAVQCGNGFHGYQCARLNRYDAVT